MTVNVGESTTVSACFNDANGDMLSYSVSSSNPSVATATASGTSVNITAVSPGNATISISANDPGGLSGSSSVSVTVPNRAPRPVGDIASLTVVAGETESVNVSGNFMEPDGQTLSYSASSSDTDVATASASGSTIAVTAVGRGMATVTVTATDPGGASATQSFQVTVPNRAPEPRGSIPEQEVRSGETANVDPGPYFADPDGDALTYTASSSTPTVATVSVAGRLLRITGVGSGRTTVTVTARDPGGETATQSFRVTVPNRGPTPVGTIPAQSVTEGSTKTLVLRPYFNDPDGDNLTYAATSANAAVAVGTVSGNVLTIRAVASGFTVITITARDPGGLTATQIVTVEVSAANRAPQPQGTIPAQTVNVGSRTTLNLSSYFTDPDNDPLTYRASSANAAVATVTVAGATLTITGRSAGNTTVTVTANDGSLTSNPHRVSVSVGAATAPDLLFSDVRPPEITVAPGDTEVLRFTIRNSGNANSAPTAARGYESTDATISTRDRVATNDVQVQGLVPGGTFTITLNLRISSNAPAGVFYVGMCVDPATGESNANNNCSSAVKVTVALPRPDLAVTRITPTTVTVAPGGAGSNVTFRVENQGSADARATDAYYYESDDNTISTSDTQVGSKAAIPALAAGATHNEPETIQSARAPGSQYWYGMCIEAAKGASGAADESNLANNCSPAVQVGVVRAGGPDLVVAGADPVAVSVRVGQSQDVAFTIQNVGDAATGAFTSATVLRSADNVVTVADRAETVFPVPILNSLATHQYTYTVTGAGSVGDVYYLGICMDASGANGEPAGTQQGNNCSTAADGAVVTVVIVSASTRQSAVKQANDSRTRGLVSRPSPVGVARPEPVENGPLPPGSFTMVVKSVEARGSTGR